MDLTIIVSPLVSALIAAVAAYVATKNSNNEKFAELRAQNAEQTAEIRGLKEQVRRFNDLAERIYKLEGNVTTAFKRIDELRAREDRIENRLNNVRGDA